MNRKPRHAPASDKAPKANSRKDVAAWMQKRHRGQGTSPLSFENVQILVEMFFTNALEPYDHPCSGDGVDSDESSSTAGIRDFLDRVLAGMPAEPGSAVEDAIKRIRDGWRMWKDVEASAKAGDFPSAILGAFFAGAFLRGGEEFLSDKAKQIGINASLSRMAATAEKGCLREQRRTAARQELQRRLASNPRLTKTSAIKAMAKERNEHNKLQWGSERTLMEYCKDLDTPR